MELHIPDVPAVAPTAPSPAISGLNASEAAGLEINGYQLRDLLGEGGFAQVWSAQHIPLGRLVAVKLFKRKVEGHSPALLEEMARKEATLHARLPETLDVPRVHDFFPCAAGLAGDAYGWALVMQHLGGPSLQDRLRDLLKEHCRCGDEALRRRLSEGQAEWATADKDIDHAAYRREMVELVRAFAGVVRTAGELHKRGIVHLDITPRNIRADEQGRLYLLDCGLARNLSPKGQATNGLSRAKSHQYCSPEQYRNEVLDARSDIYALGATLHHILCLLPPNSGVDVRSGHDFMVKRDGGVAVDGINTTLDPGIARVVAAAMADSPEGRYANAESMHEAIQAWLRSPGGEPPLAEALGSLHDLLLDGMTEGLSKRGAIPYGSKVAGGKWLDLYRLVQYGLLRMEADGFRLPHLARGEARTFSTRNGEEWVEKLAMGHLTTFLLAGGANRTVSVDAGSTTLWVLRALYFHELCGHTRGDEIHSNNLIALSETKNLPLLTAWFAYGGKIERRTNAITENVATAISRGAELSATVIGINALRKKKQRQNALWPLQLVTHTGEEGPIKAAMIRKAQWVIVVLNPKKFGIWEDGIRLRPSANFPRLLSGTKRLTLVTSVPFFYGDEKAEFDARRAGFVSKVQEFVGGVPSGRFEGTLYAVPLVPACLARVSGLADLHPKMVQAGRLLDEITDMSREYPDSIICIGLEHIKG